MAKHTQANRFRLTDEVWERMAVLVPARVNTHPLGGGRPRVPDRVCADAIFFVLRTGCQWNALDAIDGLCSSSTAHARFQEWVDSGVFLMLWQVALVQYDGVVGLDWQWQSMDGAMTKAPLAGGLTGKNPTDRGKIGTKRSVRTDAAGIPIGIAVGGANRNDFKLAKETIESCPIEQPTPTDNSPQGMCLDKGYDYDEIRELLDHFGFTAHIRARGEEAAACRAGTRARRWVVERTHSWLNRYRRILTRWEKNPANYLAMLHLACAIITFQATGLFG